MLGAETSYSLRKFLDGAAAAVTDPETSVSVRDRALAAVQVRALASDASPEVKAQAKIAREGGVHHSAYDTFEHFSRFGDPGFVYSVTLAKTVGRLVLRAADADLAPFQFSDMADVVAAETEELK